MEEMRLKPIPLDNDYWVSNTGRIFSMKRGKCLEMALFDHHKRSGPCMTIKLCHGGRKNQKTYSVHFLVIITFGPPKPEGAYLIRHLNGDYKINDIDNLQWGTDLENAADRKRHVAEKDMDIEMDW